MDNRIKLIKEKLAEAHLAIDDVGDMLKRVLPKGAKIYFKRGNMATAAPGTVLGSNMCCSWPRIRVENQLTGKKRNIGLRDVVSII